MNIDNVNQKKVENINRIGVSLNDNTYQKLDKLCDSFGLGRSAMISFVLNDYFINYEKRKNENLN